jgi:predicted nucleotidyltransferase
MKQPDTVANMVKQEAIASAVQRLVSAAHSPLKVILLGSYAKGTADEQSDLDLLVVEDEIPDMAEEYSRLRGAIGAIGAGVDVLLYPKKEFERRANWQTSPVYDAVRSGKVLYECIT